MALFNRISFHNFSRKLSAFSLFLPVLFLSYWSFQLHFIFMKVFLSPDIILCGWLGSEHELTNNLFFFFCQGRRCSSVQSLDRLVHRGDIWTNLQRSSSLFFLSVEGHCEQFWHGRGWGCPLFDVVLTAFSLPSTALPPPLTPNQGVGGTVVARDMFRHFMQALQNTSKSSFTGKIKPP